MKLCSDGHEEVCYETMECPACAVISEMQERLDALNHELVNVTDERDELLKEDEAT